MTGSPLTEFEELIASTAHWDFAVGYPRLAPISKQLKRYKELLAATEASLGRQAPVNALRAGLRGLLGEAVADLAVTYSGSISLERTISALIPESRPTLIIEPGFDIIYSFVRRVAPLLPRCIYIDPFLPHQESVEMLIAGIDNTIGAVVLASPANPSGFTLSSAELLQVARACAAADAILIVDHCFILLDPNDCHPGAAFNLADACRWAALWDSSKTIELLGERLGIVSGSPNELAAVRHTLAEIQFELPMISMLVTAKAIDDLRSGTYLPALRELIKDNYDKLRAACCSADIRINRPDAGSFALIGIDSRRFGTAEDVSRWLLRKRDIGVLPASLFYASQVPSHADFIRISMARPTEAIAVLCEAIIALANTLFRIAVTQRNLCGYAEYTPVLQLPFHVECPPAVFSVTGVLQLAVT